MASATTYNIELRSKNGYLKAYLTPWVIDVGWAWNRIGGCGSCRIKVAKAYREIEFDAGDDVQIRLKSGSTSKLVYRGWVSVVIPSLKIPQDITLEVRGYFDRLDSLVVHDSGGRKTYANDTVSTIVDDIVDNFIVANTSITKGTIDAAVFSPDSIQFKGTVAEALKTLADLEGKIEYGVDEDLVFYWRTQNSTISHKFIVGNNVQLFERRVDWSQLLNKIYFEGGEVDGETYIKTAEASDSQSQYYLAEGIITNSAITTSTVADQYLGSILKEKASPRLVIRAKVPNISTRIEDTIPLGACAIYDADYDEDYYIYGTAGNGGSDLTYGLDANGGSNATYGGVYSGQIDQIKYSLSNTSERMSVEIVLGGSLSEFSAKVAQLELLLSNIRQR